MTSLFFNNQSIETMHQQIPRRRGILGASLIIFILSGSFSTAVRPNGNHMITVEVKDLRSDKGTVLFALYNDEKALPDEHYKKYFKILKGSIAGGRSEVVFRDIPPGVYALNVLHDENKNGKIDKGFILPKEGIGFSNINRIGLGNKPNFKKAAFSLDRDMKMQVKMIYL